ncbi:MAG TPA: substrate-binding domain-containing protein, partial [Thermomicrobiales bacterium]|nr:substrate-binding domain-containing protein [Thermomicrobiales bacterium]
MTRFRIQSVLLSVMMLLGVSMGAFAQDATPVPQTRVQPPPAVEKQDTPTKVAVVPGGPHPYFAPMEGATADAVKDFGLGGGTFKSPAEWDLGAQNELIETMVAQGYNAFAIFPGDANGTNGTIEELMSQGIPTVDVGGCTSQPSQAQFCIAT